MGGRGGRKRRAAGRGGAHVLRNEQVGVMREVGILMGEGGDGNGRRGDGRDRMMGGCSGDQEGKRQEVGRNLGGQ